MTPFRPIAAITLPAFIPAIVTVAVTTSTLTTAMMMAITITKYYSHGDSNDCTFTDTAHVTNLPLWLPLLLLLATIFLLLRRHYDYGC